MCARFKLISVKVLMRQKTVQQLGAVEKNHLDKKVPVAQDRELREHRIMWVVEWCLVLHQELIG